MRDPDNTLLARGPQQRLPAEMIRDNALCVSGLLVEKVGGPPVKPYEPEGLWKEKSGQDYVRDEGEGSHRRSLYTFWKRTSPPPSMMILDAPNGMSVLLAARQPPRRCRLWYCGTTRNMWKLPERLLSEPCSKLTRVWRSS